MSDIAISRGVRSNLLTLQNVASQREQIQGRLATGKKVNSALDNPSNFFTSSALNARAKDLTNLLDGISNATKTLEAADKGIKGVTRLVESAQAKIREGLQSAAAQPTTETGSSTVAANLSKGLVASLGLTHGSGSAPTISVGVNGKSFSVTVSDTDTLQNAVDNINQVLGSNGNVSVGTDGKVSVRNNTSSALTLSLTDGSSATSAKSIGDIFGDPVSTLSSVAAAGSTANYDAYATQFNELLSQVTKLAQDATYNGKNLLNGDSIDVIFNEKSVGANKLTVNGTDFTATGLGLNNIAATGSTATDFTNAQTKLQDALSTIRSQSSKFGSNLSVVQTRQDFTKDLVNTLRTGADNLVLADQNEEGANLLALNTRAQLATSALSFASQADQQVLQFLR
jgi:flagellin